MFYEIVTNFMQTSIDPNQFIKVTNPYNLSYNI